jgi:lysophospholipase L1-like esterase
VKQATRRTLVYGALALPAALVGAAGFLYAEAMYAVHRGLPTVTGHDPSGEVGDPAHPEVTLLLLGDSTLTGSGLESVDDIWVRQMAARLSGEFRIRIVSVATGGARTAEVRRDQLPQALRTRADLAIVSAGANDVMHVTPLREIERDLTAIVAELHAVVPEVLLTGVGDLGNVPRVPFPLTLVASARSRSVDRIHRQVAERFDYADKVPVGAMTAGFSRDRSLFGPDWFHPSRAGHAIWADAATPVVRGVLERVVRQRRAHA